MHVHSPIFQGQLIVKKIRAITSIKFGCQGGLKKCQKKWYKNVKNIFFLFNKYQCDTCFYINFSKVFQKYNFKICSFSHTKNIDYFRTYFNTDRTLYRQLYPMHSKIYFLKSFKLLFNKSHKISR